MKNQCTTVTGDLRKTGRQNLAVSLPQTGNFGDSYSN